MQTQLTTYYDLVEHLLDYAGGDVSDANMRGCQRAIAAGYREFHASRDWSYLMQRGRLTTVAPYSTGTIAYTNSTRQVTLTGGTWPTWAAFGTLVIGDVAYEVSERTSGSVLVLSQSSNPGADVAAGTSYSICRDTYPMPCDYQAGQDMIEASSGYRLPYISPGDWLPRARVAYGPGKPSFFTVTADPNYFGAMAARFSPRPDAAYVLDFIYRRRPRQLVTIDYNASSVSATAASTTLSGDGTAWTSRMVGSVIRLSAAGESNPPTGNMGQYPYLYERIITAVASATSLTVDEAIPETLSAVKHRVSDPVDIEDGAMLTALLRECERQFRRIKRMEPVKGGEEANDYQMAMYRAAEADSRSLSPRVAGGPLRYRMRLADMPINLAGEGL